MDLSEGDKQELLRIARSAIQSAVEGKPPPTIEPSSEVMNQPCGAFATLRIGDDLRGCVGYVEGRFPLAQTVQEVAVKAAFEDPRFLPLSREELHQIEIEISVLSPLDQVTKIEEIEVGKHGLILDTGARRGLLLPQVATEYRWDREQFLSHTALKAGLPPDAWKIPGVHILKFTAEKFSESEFSLKKP